MTACAVCGSGKQITDNKDECGMYFYKCLVKRKAASGTRSHDCFKFMSWCSLILKLRTSVRFCEGLVVENSQLLSKEVRAKESSVVMVTCLAGFSLIGSEEVSCLTEGTWTTVPTCHKRGESLNMSIE